METYRDHKHARRAVAPIIATLLMVAISVVGGILIFVFAQGFFTDTNIGAPSIESLFIFGYDATNNVLLKPHNFDSAIADEAEGGAQTMNAANTGTDVGKLIDGDHIAVYIRNLGNQAVVISSIKIYGDTYSPVSAAACSATVPAAGEFSVSADGTNDDCVNGPTISPGTDATIYIGYEDDSNGKIKLGRPLPITIVTSNGAGFSKQLQMGVQLGA